MRNEILQLLLTHDYPMQVQELAVASHKSRRTVYHTINKINTYLTAAGVAEIHYTKHAGYLLDQQQKAVFRSIKPFRSKLERMNMIILHCINYGTITNQRLVSLLGVSANTIRNDIKKIQQDFPEFNIQGTHAGYCVSAPEVVQIDWVMAHLNLLETVKSEEVTALVEEFETLTNAQLTGSGRIDFAKWINWFLHRIKQFGDTYSLSYNHQANVKFVVVANRLLYRQGIDNLNVSLYLADAMNKFQYNVMPYPMLSDDVVEESLNQIIDRFEEISSITINHKRVYDLMRVHFNGLYNRMINDSQIHSDVIQPMMKNAGDVYALTKLSLIDLEQRTGKVINDDECALLATYFGGEVRRIKNEAAASQVLIYCANGIGTSQLVVLTLREKFPMIKFEIIHNLNVIAELNSAKLLISTIKLTRQLNIPVVEVSPLLTALDLQHVASKLQEYGLITTSSMNSVTVDGLIDIIFEYTKVMNFSALKESLEKYLQGDERPSRQSEEVFIQANCVTKPIENWQQAVRMGVQILVDGHITTANYADEIIKLTMENGPYMVLGKHIMLAHSRQPSEAVGFSFLRLSEPVTCLGKSVQIIITMASPNQEAHLNFLAKLSPKISSGDLTDQLLTMTSTQEMMSYLSTL